MNTAAKDKVVTINDHRFKFSDLSEDTGKLFFSLRVSDQEIERLHTQLGIAQITRNAYARA